MNVQVQVGFEVITDFTSEVLRICSPSILGMGDAPLVSLYN